MVVSKILEANPLIQELNLSKCYMNIDQLRKCLPSLLKMKNLRSLDLSDNELGCDLSGEYISELIKNNPVNLKKLVLTD